MSGVDTPVGISPFRKEDAARARDQDPLAEGDSKDVEGGTDRNESVRDPFAHGRSIKSRCREVLTIAEVAINVLSVSKKSF